MDAPIASQLLQSDLIVLHNLRRDVRLTAKGTNKDVEDSCSTFDDQSSMRALDELRNEPTVFTNWDLKDLPTGKSLRAEALRIYIPWAQGVVRNPVDVVFLTHLLLYFATSVPSALYLYCHFTWVHGIVHVLMQLSYCGSFTLMHHNHIHNNGLLKKEYTWFDNGWPYIIGPLMGHTWNSYYYHHVKHHHVEGNGPEDLSTTIRLQRDELGDFLYYVARFAFLAWIELPLYFYRKQKPMLAFKSALGEWSSCICIIFLAKWNFYPTLFVFLLPLLLMRIGLMIGNFGQHALVDEFDPASDFRSSITLIDVPVCRY